MEVGGLSSQSVYPVEVQNLQQNDVDVTGYFEDSEPNIEVPGTSPNTAEPTDQESEDGGNVRGVIRNLQNGHFKGVSDVRLRINFFDEIAALECQQLQVVAEEKIGVVLESVGESFTTFLESEEFTEQHHEIIGSQDAFAQAVNELKKEFTTGDGLSKEDLLVGLKATFQDLLGSLGKVLPTTTTETPEAEVVPEDNVGEKGVAANPLGHKEDVAPKQAPTSELESNFQTFIEKLTSAFDTALEQLASDLNEVEILPELTEPIGNGVAYSKFLTIYNELRGNETDARPNNGEQFEAVA